MPHRPDPRLLRVRIRDPHAPSGWRLAYQRPDVPRRAPIRLIQTALVAAAIAGIAVGEVVHYLVSAS